MANKPDELASARPAAAAAPVPGPRPAAARGGAAPACPATEAETAALAQLFEGLDRPGEPILSADAAFPMLARLARSESPFARAFAYRHLARLHARDLRYETLAKRVLAQARQRERGVLRERLERLLRLC